MALLLDSGAVSFLASRNQRAGALLGALQHEGLWPPVVLSPVLVECLQGDSGRDANTDRLLKSCDIVTEIDEAVARRAAWLRAQARCGSAVDALIVAYADPAGSVLTGDSADITALSANARDVQVARI